MISLLVTAASNANAFTYTRNTTICQKETKSSFLPFLKSWETTKFPSFSRNCRIRLCTINPKSKFLYVKMTWVGQKYRIHVIWEFQIVLKVKIGHFWAFFAYSKPLITLIWHECGIFDLLISFFYIKTYFCINGAWPNSCK